MVTQPTKGNAPTPDASNTTSASGATETVKVARGRSIRHEGKTYTAGQEVTLPAADLARLRPLGFIASEREASQDDSEERARTQGPTFESKEGPNVKQKR